MIVHHQSSYEDDLALAVSSELARLTHELNPFTEGVRYRSVRVDGTYPAGAVVVRFEQVEHPGQQFGLNLPLAAWAAPDDADRHAGEPMPIPAIEVAELIGIQLDQHLELGYFTPPTTTPAEDGVTWLTLDQDGYR